MSFNPDIRNLGGRKILVDQIYNHYISLSKIKSTLNTLESRPSLVKKVNRTETPVLLKQAADQKNTIALQERVSKAKKKIDSNEPVSFNQIRKGQPCGASSKQYQFMMFEHFKNLKSQKSRIESQSSMSERKKNFYDTTAYPAMFFRRVNESMNSSKSVISTNNRPDRSGIQSAQLSNRNQNNEGQQQEYIQQHEGVQTQKNNYYFSQPTPKQFQGISNTDLANSVGEQTAKTPVKKTKFPINNSGNKQFANSTQADTLASQILKSSSFSSSKQHSQLLNHSISTTLQRLSPEASVNLNPQQKQQLYVQIKEQQQRQQFQQGAHQKQQSLTQEEEEQRWLKILEEIPVLLDINENSLSLLKEHLVNLIIKYRLYKADDYSIMKSLFDQKNSQINEQLSAAIFEEIVNALNE